MADVQMRVLCKGTLLQLMKVTDLTVLAMVCPHNHQGCDKNPERGREQVYMHADVCVRMHYVCMYVHEQMYIYMFTYTYMCVCAIYLYIYISISIYIYIYI